MPLLWGYKIVVQTRNYLFDHNILHQETFDVPIICIGNITVGGTGKTPMIEYLIRILSSKFRVAVLSRGYKRKTTGFHIVTSDSTVLEVGDEPKQLKQKYPDVIVAVDSNRRRGVQQLLNGETKYRPEVILLDDGFQHRYVKPSFAIVLEDYSRPIFEDCLLPLGRLREPHSAIYRASMVIVTKMPEEFNPIDIRIIQKRLNLFPYQKLGFTTINYADHLKPLKSDGLCDLNINALNNYDIILVTAIGNPYPFISHIEKIKNPISTMNFSDHHYFSDSELEEMRKKIKENKDGNPLIITTEKDAMRLNDAITPEDILRNYIYYLPISIKFLYENEEDTFIKTIINHVEKNQ